VNVRWQSKERGFVLIVTMLVIMILATILMEFSYESRVNLEAADNIHGDAQALCAARAGVEVARSILATSTDLLGDEDIAPFLDRGEPVAVGPGRVTVRIVPESGKINVNRLKDAGGKVVRRRVDQLLRLCDVLNRMYGETSPIGYGIVPAMIDWVDEDDDVTVLPFVSRENEGAEDSDYRGLDPPRGCKNARFDTTGEIQLVRGVSPGLFDGRAGDAETGARAVPGLRDLLTVYGDGKIDLNYAPVTVIQSLSENMDEAVAHEIVARRRTQAFRSTAEMKDVPGISSGMYDRLKQIVATRSEEHFFTVVCDAEVGEFRRIVRAVLRRSKSGQVSTVLFSSE